MSASPGLAARFALRELRGGIHGFRVLITCLALGVAAIAAVGNVRMAIETGLDRNAAVLLGGDAEIEFSYRFANAEERAWMEANSEAISELVDFRSMLGSGPTEAPTRTLVQVKAVDDAHPLYGSLTLEGATDIALDITSALAPQDGTPGLIADTTLIDQLGLAIGDTVSLGEQSFRISARLLQEPDSVTQGISLGRASSSCAATSPPPVSSPKARSSKAPTASAWRPTPTSPPCAMRPESFSPMTACNGATGAAACPACPASSTAWRISSCFWASRASPWAGSVSRRP